MLRWTKVIQQVLLQCVKFQCQLTEQDGVWMGAYSGPDIGPIRVTAASRDEALRKLEAEIHYWLEMCPCSGETYKDIQIELVEAA